MLNVLHSSSNPSSTTTHSGHHKAPPEFCDYVPDLGQFGLETERSFRINEFYYSPQPDHQSGSSQNPPGGPQPPVEDYSEYFKGSYGCFNPEDLCDLVQSSQSTQPPNNGLISLGGVSSVPSQSLLQPVIAPSSSSSSSTPAVLSHISTLMHDISGSMSFTDVSLRTHKGQELRVHASILASHSTFLRELLRCTPSEEGQLFLLLPDVEIYHLSMMIGFFYSGEVTLSQQKDLLPLRQLSHCLGVHSLIGRLDDLSLSLSNPYDGNPPILLQSLDSEELPHLSNSEIDSSIYLAPPQSTTSDGGRVPEAQGGRVKKKAFSCSRCSSKFYTHESLHVHESLHEEVKPFSCGVCGKSIASKAHLAVHMRIHSGEKPFACDACEKSFMDGSSLKRHKASHGDRVSHECEACGKVFGDRSTFKRHYKEKHVEGSKKYECHLCGKLFHRKETLNAHFVKVHSLSGEEIAQRDKAKEIEDSKKWKTFKCEVCGMMFSKQSTMEIHLRTHTGDKPYVCEVCGKKFTRSNNLKLHKRVHTGEKPYQCSQCDKRFSDVSAHKRHLRTHTGERPYECMQCGKGFIQIGAKNAHEKTCLLSSSKELESDNKKTTTSMLPSTVPGPLYVSQDASNYNPLVEDSSLVSLSNHSDLQPISI